MIRRVYPTPIPARPEMQFAAARALTGEWLDWDLPLADVEVTWETSGPGGVKASIDPEVSRLAASDGLAVLEPWSTAVYAVDSRLVRAGALVVSVGYEGQKMSLECAGFATYPHGIPWGGDYAATYVDPLDVVRLVWGHVQSYPDSDLGVTVGAGTSPVRIGTELDGDGQVTPYQLRWWENTDCGAEVDKLADETPFDYRERHWFADAGGVAHLIELGHPRLGRRRTDLRFAQGENITDMVAPNRGGDGFAQNALGLGAGEGRAMIRAYLPHRDGRLRRVTTVADKSVQSRRRMAALARRELATTRRMLTIPTVTVDARHPNAPLGSWQMGDIITVLAEVPWVGEVALDHRITRATYRPATEQATLDLEPL